MLRFPESIFCVTHLIESYFMIYKPNIQFKHIIAALTNKQTSPNAFNGSQFHVYKFVFIQLHL